MCERHDVNPEVYLADVLLRIHNQPKDDFAARLPRRWKETDGSGFVAENHRTRRRGLSGRRNHIDLTRYMRATTRSRDPAREMAVNGSAEIREAPLQEYP